MALLGQTLPPFCVCVDRADLFWKNNLRSRGRADDLAEPPEVGRAPGDRASLAHIVPEQKGVQMHFRGLEGTESLFPRAAQVAEGCLCHWGDLDGGQVS